MKRIVIIEDQQLLRELVTNIVVHDLHCEVVGQYDDGEKGLEACLKLQPDLVVLDLVIPGIGGLGVLRQLKQHLPEIKVVVLSGNLTPENVRLLADSGVNGIFTKDCAVDRLKDALLQVMEGGVFYSPEAYRLLRECTSGINSHDPRSLLTNREVDVLQLVGEGFASKEIADKLHISVRTVEAHRSNIMRKLNLRGATDMTRMAVRLNLVSG